VTRYDWLLFLHIAGAFVVLGGATMAGAFNLFALGRERASEIVLLYRLVRFAAVAIPVGMVVALAFGLWLVDEAGYGWGEAWIVIALVLWVVANALGGIGGKREKETRQLAERLVAEGDVVTPELRARLRDPVTLALSWGSGLAVLAILALMIWKPGA
jgi:uncharacterized membrane protein